MLIIGSEVNTGFGATAFHLTDCVVVEVIFAENVSVGGIGVEVSTTGAGGSATVSIFILLVVFPPEPLQLSEIVDGPVTGIDVTVPKVMFCALGFTNEVIVDGQTGFVPPVVQLFAFEAFQLIETAEPLETIIEVVTEIGLP